MKIDWKQKLSSRKLWAALAAAMLSAAAVLMGEEIPAAAVELIEKGVYGLIAYIFGEAFVDAARIFGEAKVSAAAESAKKTIDVSIPDIGGGTAEE